MPTILKIGSNRFHFYSNENQEPPHIHVRTPNGECKFWLNNIQLAKNIGIPVHKLHEIEKLVYKNKEFLMEKYYEFYNN